ncbi:hypothetical protein Tco_0910488 [Tanacetum coccineum]|uniref:Uncharacterized protein n=1 Tax=Tanacetum coccineum TaxID=301880 RepID=A0ABQ5CVA3_9ASTR
MDKVHRWLRVGVNKGRHKSSRNMQTTRPNTFCIPSPPVSFPVWCILESHNSFSLSVDPREPEPDGRSSFPARLMPWFHLSIFIVVLTEVFETNRRVGISRSGSMICKWHVFKSSGGKHGSSYRQSFASGVAWHDQASMRSKDALGVILGVMYHDLYFGGKNLIEIENVGLTFAQVLSKAHREGEDPIRASKGRPSNRKGGYVIIKYLKDVKKRKKSKSAKQKEKFEWKPTGQIFKTVGLKWIPTGRIANLVGEQFPLSGNTSTIVIPPGQTLTTTVIPVDEPLDMPMPGNPSLDHS